MDSILPTQFTSEVKLKKIRTKNFYQLSFFLFFVLEFLITYLQIFKKYGGEDSDTLSHIAFISKIGSFDFPQMGFEYTVYFLSKLTNLSYEWVTVVLLSLIVGGQAFFTNFLFQKFTKVSDLRCFIFTLFAMTCTSIYIPYFNLPLNQLHVQESLNVYFLAHPHLPIINSLISWGVKFCSHFTLFGVGSPNIWHSPTFFIIKFIGFLLTYLYLHHNKSNIKVKIIIATTLAFTCFFKPSFATIFIPAVIVYELFTNNNKILISLKKSLSITLPALFTLGIMIYILSYIYHTPDGHESHVIFAPLGVIHLFVKNAAGALLEALAFPLLILVIRFRYILRENQDLVFAWLMLIFGYLLWALLAQSGEFFYASANFAWGYDLGLSFVYTFSLIEYLKMVTPVNQHANSLTKNKAVYYLVSFVLALSVLSGWYYLLKIVLNIPAV